MQNFSSDWSPQIIVDLIEAVIWPLILLIIAIVFRSGTYDNLRNFFLKNSVSEVSATASGFSAKFVAAK